MREEKSRKETLKTPQTHKGEKYTDENYLHPSVPGDVKMKHHFLGAKRKRGRRRRRRRTQRKRVSERVFSFFYFSFSFSLFIHPSLSGHNATLVVLSFSPREGVSVSTFFSEGTRHTSFQVQFNGHSKHAHWFMKKFLLDRRRCAISADTLSS